jgi:hypothetical protein
MTQKRIRLTKRELDAIQEALHCRLAGERDIEGEAGAPRTEDYEGALNKISDMLARA